METEMIGVFVVLAPIVVAWAVYGAGELATRIRYARRRDYGSF